MRAAVEGTSSSESARNAPRHGAPVVISRAGDPRTRRPRAAPRGLAGPSPRGTCAAPTCLAMRDLDEADPKAPHPVQFPKKRTNPLEGAERAPWNLRKDDDRDRHRHV